MSSDRAPFSVLFVCLGNICRSPAAEIIFTHMARERGIAGRIASDSAGTIGYHQGAPPDARMTAALTKKGYDVFGASRQIVADDLTRFDWIVTMDQQNFRNVCELDTHQKHVGKVRPFVGFCREHEVKDVPDPYYGGTRGFDFVIELLEDGCAAMLDELEKRV